MALAAVGDYARIRTHACLAQRGYLFVDVAGVRYAVRAGAILEGLPLTASSAMLINPHEENVNERINALVDCVLRFDARTFGEPRIRVEQNANGTITALASVEYFPV